MTKKQTIGCPFKSEERYGMNKNMRMKALNKKDTKNKQMRKLILIRAQCTAYRKIILIL